MSSPELYVDPRLAFLDCKRIGVTSALLTFDRIVGLKNLSVDLVQQIGQSVLQGVDRSVCPCARENALRKTPKQCVL